MLDETNVPLESKIFKAKENMRPANPKQTTVRRPVKFEVSQKPTKKGHEHGDLLFLPHAMHFFAATHLYLTANPKVLYTEQLVQRRGHRCWTWRD
jgi:hypothetical protein